MILKIDTTSQEEVQKGLDVLNFLNQTETPQDPPKEEKVPKKEAPKKETPKKEAPKKTKEGLTTQDVRAALQEKVDNHRPAIKEKLTELGANNVSSLDEEKYQEFFDFLKGLE